MAVLTSGFGFRGTSSFVVWVHATLWYVFDIVGGPELVQIILRALTETRSLSPEEIQAAMAVLGPQAIRYRDVRIATGGVLLTFFRMNRNRAFATWHTINIPASRISDLSLLVHELTHVYQYERVGSLYIGQGLWAQHTFGRKAYDYGGVDGLAEGRATGKCLYDYNREQQCQIAQDYVVLLHEDGDTEAYSPFIHELRHGLI
jgi:hypothetical protein